MLFRVICPLGPIATDVEGWVQEELVRQAQQGDAEAFDSLARMVGDRCVAIAVRILRDIDLSQNAVVCDRSLLLTLPLHALE